MPAAKKPAARKRAPAQPDPTPAPEPTTPSASETATDHGQAELQANADEIYNVGLHGDEVDSTPNSHYSVAGVTAGKPTPETETR